jgi:hypothetical protein
MDSYGFLGIPTQPLRWYDWAHIRMSMVAHELLLSYLSCYRARRHIYADTKSKTSSSALTHKASEPRMPITSSLCILWSIVLPDLQCSLNFLAMAPALFCTWTNGVRAAWCQSRHVNRVWATRFMRSSGLGRWWQAYLWQNKVLYVSRHQPRIRLCSSESCARVVLIRWVDSLLRRPALGNAHPWWMK